MNFRFANKKDVPEIVEVIRQAFLMSYNGEDDDGNNTADTFAYYYNFAEYIPENIAIAEIDGKIVSMAGIVPLPIVKENTKIKAAQLSPVATLKEFRSKGIAARCIENLCDLLRKEGHSLFYVSGHEEYYPKLGFLPVFRVYGGKISTERLSNINSTAEVIQYSKEYNEGILEVYNKSTSLNLLKVERDNAWINRKIVSKKDGEFPCCTILDKNIFLARYNGEITGYAFLNDESDNVVVEEMKAVNKDSVLALLKQLEKIAKVRGAKEIYIYRTMPEEITYRTLLDLSGVVTIFNSKPYMLKILSVTNLMNSMNDIFNERIRNSELADKHFDIVIESNNEEVRFNKTNEHIKVQANVPNTNSKSISIPIEALTSLFAGYKSIFEIIEDGECSSISYEEAKILNILFPKHNMYISSIDMI